MSNLTLLIPAKFESESLPIFLEELKNYNYKKLVILDQSDTKTIESIKNFSDVEILYQNQTGYGNALIEGINYTKTDLFCIINADGSMNPNELDGMLSEINNNNQDIVFGSRYMKNADSDDDDIVTSIGNFMFTLVGKIFFKLKISDILYTYLIGKTKLVQDLSLQSGDFKFCIELPIKAKRKNLKCISYPCHERSRIGGKKKVNPLLDGFKILLGMIFLFFKR
jgi:glycosyltransferase involved in cell wall biosynthesis|tara:strand:- start:352 stop:1023 length:672 start_codon:yes stop_codon:yes gene_type:complete